MADKFNKTIYPKKYPYPRGILNVNHNIKVINCSPALGAVCGGEHPSLVEYGAAAEVGAKEAPEGRLVRYAASGGVHAAHYAGVRTHQKVSAYHRPLSLVLPLY